LRRAAITWVYAASKAANISAVTMAGNWAVGSIRP
jgi:hypothetical protein